MQSALFVLDRDPPCTAVCASVKHESIFEAADSLLTELCACFPLGYQPRIVWRGYRVSAGMAYYKEGVIGLSRTVITDYEKMRDTLVHEYAHLLAVVRKGRKAAGHGEPWQQAMRPAS